MNKRQFRSQVTPAREVPPGTEDPRYPTVDEFESGRRDFLARFGASLLGAGAMAALAGCGSSDRAVGSKPDAGPNKDHGQLSGAAPMPDAQADQGHEMGMMGEAPQPDASIDQGPTPGYAPAPDAKVDHNDGMMGGKPRMPDAKVDKKDHGLSGAAPMPDAKVDKKVPKQDGMTGGAPMPEARRDRRGRSPR